MEATSSKLFKFGNLAILSFLIIGILSFPIFYTPTNQEPYFQPSGVSSYNEIKQLVDGADLIKIQKEALDKAEKENRERSRNHHNGIVLLLTVISASCLNLYVFRESAVVKGFIEELNNKEEKKKILAKEEADHQEAMLAEVRKSEILPLKAENARLSKSIPVSDERTDIETERLRIENERLRAEISLMTNKENVDEDELRRLIEMQRLRAEVKKSEAQARSESYQADIDEHTRNETIGKNPRS